MRKSHEEFVKEVFTSVGDVYLFLNEYTTKRNKIDVIHKICGERLSMLPQSIRTGACSNCAKLNNRYDIKRVSEYLEEKGLELISTKYVSCKEKLKLRCYCGELFDASFDNIKNGKRKACVNCQPLTTFKRGKVAHNKKSLAEFKQQVNEISNEHVVLGNYIDSHEKVDILHLKCNRVWRITPTHFLSRKGGCKYCNESIGERACRNALESQKLIFESQKKYINCKNKKQLPFDFVVYKDEKILHIEYDGEQHFMEIDYYGVDKFKMCVINDKIKNQYCVDNNIPLVRIPYTQQKNINYILHNALIHFELIENEQDTYDKDVVMKYLVDSDWNHDDYIEDNIKYQTL